MKNDDQKHVTPGRPGVAYPVAGAALALAALVAIALLPRAYAQEPVFAKGGGLDLRNQVFDEMNIYKLEGEWQFWWDAFVDPQSIVRGDAPVPTDIVPMPQY